MFVLSLLLLLMTSQAHGGVIPSDDDVMPGQPPGDMEELLKLAQEASLKGAVGADGLSEKEAEAAQISVNGASESQTGEKEVEDAGENTGMEAIVQALEEEEEEVGEKVNDKDLIKQALEIEKSNGTVQGVPAAKLGGLSPGEGAGGDEKKKRQFSHGASRWDKGIIPYTFNVATTDSQCPESAEGQQQVRTAMEYYEAHTCLKFVPHTATSKEENGLSHDNYLQFIQDTNSHGCWSYIGNTGGTGQRIACCGQVGAALHEIGHALGRPHEQDRAMRDEYVILHPQSADPRHRSAFSGRPQTNLDEDLAPYDLSSRMHYHNYAFSMDGMETLSAADPWESFLIGLRNDLLSHYDLMAVNKAYKCQDRCPDPNKQCQNDGFLGIENGKCKCVCPYGIMGDSCERTYKYDYGPTAWPEGPYGLPMPNTSCPQGDWEEGSRTHVLGWIRVKDSNSEEMFPMSTWLDEGRVCDHMCMRKVGQTSTESGKKATWPPGSYCIYQQGDTCPQGFTSASLYFDDLATGDTLNDKSGSLPKGEYGEDTAYYYCCRNDAPATDAIQLPTHNPFMLFRTGGTCQLVEGTRVESRWLYYDVQPNDLRPVAQENVLAPEFINWWGDIWLHHCLYTPLSYDCGDVVQLSEATPSYDLKSPNFPLNYSESQECTWLIKAPEGSLIRLVFDSFDVEQNSEGKCEDMLEIRSSLLGQPGQEYCGHDFKRGILSYHGFVFLRFRSGIRGTGKGFSGTVSMIKEDSLCYNVGDQGASYNGNVNFTEHYRSCMSWEDASHCEIDPFDDKSLEKHLVGHNCCRNPNNNRRPWCFVNKYCDVEFCDVCGIGNCFDLWTNCDDLKRSKQDFCNSKMAFNGCHKSCNLCDVGRSEVVTHCGVPTSYDSHATISPQYASVTSFSVGSTVELTCSGTPYKVTRQWTCLSDGSWQGQRIFCQISCPDGWDRFHEDCYKVFGTEKVLYAQADAACAAAKAHLVSGHGEAAEPHLASIHGEEENEFCRKLTEPYGRTLIGWTDSASVGAWYWTDGSTPFYENWADHQPGLKDQFNHGASMDGQSGKWGDGYADHYLTEYPLCKMPFTGEDDSDENCQDEEPQCERILSEQPDICQDIRYDRYACRNCRRSCGFCPHLECAQPAPGENTISLTKDLFLQAGRSFSYKCKNDTYELAEGNLKRVCLRAGKVSGDVPKCKPKSELTQEFGYRPMRRPSQERGGLVVVTLTNKTRIDRDGYVLGWHIYSQIDLTLLMQIWRPSGVNESGGSHLFTLVGSNMVKVIGGTMNTIHIPSFERIETNFGDVIGFYAPPSCTSAGIPYAHCASGYDDRLVFQVPVSNIDMFENGSVMEMTQVAQCRTYSIQAIVGIGTGMSYSLISALSRGGKCVDASSARNLCNMTLDGKLTPYDSSWVTEGEGVGAWIIIQFPYCSIVGIRLMQRCGKEGQNGKLLLTFSDNSNQTVVLSGRTGESMMDESGRAWDSFELEPVDAEWVRAEVLSVYSTHNNGFIEIEVYATCIAGWKRYKNSCYKLHTGEPAQYATAEQDCVDQGAHLVNIGCEKELEFVNKLRGDVSIYIGLKKTDATWRWADEKEPTFKNWATNEPQVHQYYDCARMDAGGKWFVNWCSWYDQQRWVCKKPAKLETVGGIGQHIGYPTQPRAKLDTAGTITLIEDSEMRLPARGAIGKWKIYSEEDSQIAFQLWRPTSLNNQYKLVGENFAQLNGGRVNFVIVPKTERFMVEEGDLFGWHLISAGLQYDVCKLESHNMVVRTVNRKDINEPLVEGTEVRFVQPTKDPCRIYSITAYGSEDSSSLNDVALGASCTASVNADLCGLVSDGNLRIPASMWMLPDGGAVGQWLRLTLSDTYVVESVCVVQGSYGGGQISTLNVELTTGHTEQLSLWNNSGSSLADYSGQTRQCLELASPVETNTITLTVSATYSNKQAGIAEVLVYAGSVSGWDTYPGSPYYYKFRGDTPKMYQAAEEDCKTLGAHLASVLGMEEDGFLLNLAKQNQKDILIGYQGKFLKSSFVWEDGSVSNFTNWGEGQPWDVGGWQTCASMSYHGNGEWTNYYRDYYNEKYWVCKMAKPVLKPPIHTSGPLSVCVTSQQGETYGGHVSYTASGKQCQRWDAQTPRAHTMTEVSAFAGGISALSEAGNFCRNPDNKASGPWCFTMEGDAPWETCGLPSCPQENTGR